MSPTGRPEIDALLSHAGWMKNLAASLVADPNQAEDLIQKTWVAALEHPPEAGRSLKGWLAAVLRNFAREERRTRLSRAAREERSARTEAIPSTHDAVAFAHLQRDLIEAVLALEEPYRDAIVWRYFEGSSPRAIATRLGVPVSTVKTRLARGIERLRAELDRRNGGNREAWLPALIPFTLKPAAPATTLGAILVNTNLKLVVAATLVAGALFGVWKISREEAPSPVPAVASAAEPSAPAPVLAPERVSSESGTRAEIGTVEPPAKPAPAPESAPTVFLHQGRVVDGEGRGVAGIDLVAGGKAEASRLTPIATSANDGSFRASAAKLRGVLFAKDERYTTVFGVDLWSDFPMSGLVVIVAPRILLAGIVVDGSGRPVAGAEVVVRPERRFLQDLGLITDQSFEARMATKTDESGRFEFQDAPGMPHAAIEVAAPGHTPAHMPAPAASKHDLRLVLDSNARSVIRGEVLDDRERPVPSAWVAAGMKATRADAEGRFELEPGEQVSVRPDGAVEWLELVAVKQGFLPARIPEPDTGWPRSIVVKLEGSPLALRGKVVDDDGQPIEGAEVWTLDEHRFANVPGKDTNMESPRTIEFMLRGTEQTKTDEHGAFELGGLIPGGYRLACSHRATLRSTVTERLDAGGPSVKIRLPSLARCVRVAGRVVSRSKAPVAEVLVFPRRILAEGDGSQWPPPSAEGESRMTDAEGRFAFESICGDDLYFQVSGPNLDIVWKWDPPPGAKLDALEIVVALRCHVQVDLGDRADLADEFAVFDAEGRVLDLVRWEGPRASIGQARPITEGRSDILATSDAAETLLLRRAGKEVQRLPLRLVPGELTVVRP